MFVFCTFKRRLITDGVPPGESQVREIDSLIDSVQRYRTEVSLKPLKKNLGYWADICHTSTTEFRLCLSLFFFQYFNASISETIVWISETRTTDEAFWQFENWTSRSRPRSGREFETFHSIRTTHSKPHVLRLSRDPIPRRIGPRVREICSNQSSHRTSFHVFYMLYFWSLSKFYTLQ